MGKLLIREFLFVLALGLFAWFGLPLLLGQSPDFVLFSLGLVVGLTCAPIYALVLLIGKRLPPAVRGWVGVFAWVFVFLNEVLVVLLGRVPRGAGVLLYFQLAPGLLGLLLAALAAQRKSDNPRSAEALHGLYVYSASMLAVRFILMPMVSVNPFLTLLAMQGGALFFLLHGLLRLYAPLGPELAVQTEPLVARRYLPDAIVGLSERTLHKRARPWATRPDGSLDETSVSLVVPRADLDDALARLAGALDGKPFVAEAGEPVAGGVEIVVRPKV